MTAASTVIAANRFGLGARPGELAAIGSDPAGWLLAQIGTVPKPSAELASTATVLGSLSELRQERRRRDIARQAGQQIPATSEAADPVLRVRDALLPHYLAQAEARVRLAASTDKPFSERLVHFWSNHFAVSIDKIACLGIAGSFENEAIRPALSGSFTDLLLSAASHPALILYLDNQASIGPNSRLGVRVQRRGSDSRKVDINENLAREILELHTLGQESGYSQADVTEFARALTGWSVGAGPGPLGAASDNGSTGDGKSGAFLFRDNVHEPGTRTVLGKRYPESGQEQPTLILKDLARHPATARHLATKLARHFIADDPPAASIDHLSTIWMRTEGDLSAVYRALVADEATWNPAPVKLKTPWEYGISAYRGLDFVPSAQRAALAPFELLGQRLWSPGSPAGWPDSASAWDGADALFKRVEWADALGERLGAMRSPMETATGMLGETLGTRTRTALLQAESAGQALTLLLASPEFLRR